MASPVRKKKAENEAAMEISDDKVNEILHPELSFQKRAEKAETELRILRDDYQSRIAGMVKAIAAVERSRNKSNEAVQYLETLEMLSAAELIEEYRRISARFRSAFPTSFGLAPFSSGKSAGVKNMGDFK